MTEHKIGIPSPAELEAVVRRAEAERAEYMAALLRKAYVAIRNLFRRQPTAEPRGPLAGAKA